MLPGLKNKPLIKRLGLSSLSTSVQALINGALQKSGGTMTGALVLPGNAVNPLEAVPKQQLDASVALSVSSLALSATGTNASVTISAGELLLRGADGSPRLVSGVSLTLNTAGTGANGLDTGTLAASTWYAVWVISNGTTTAGLVSLSSAAPTMPVGYTFKARVGWIRTDGSLNKFPLGFTQYGRRAQWRVSGGSNMTALPTMASGVQGSVSAPTWVAVSVGAYAPPTASFAVVAITGASSGTGTSMLAPSSSYGAFNSTTNSPPIVCSYGVASRSVAPHMLQIESASIYFATDIAAQLYSLGWEDNL